MTYFLFLVFHHSFHRPKQLYGVCPTRSAQVLHPPQYPSYTKRQLLVGYCVVQPKDCHLRLRPSLLLCFLKGCVSAPQTNDRRVVRAHPMHPAIEGPIGSSGAKSWVHRGCCHEERGPKPLKCRAAAAHIICCVLCLCFVLWLGVEHCILPIL